MIQRTFCSPPFHASCELPLAKSTLGTLIILLLHAANATHYKRGSPALLIETNLICSCVLDTIAYFILIIQTELHLMPLLLLGSS